MTQSVAPVLVFSWGNPSRGDDALGPKMHVEMESLAFKNVELLTDYQLQIEHCLDLQNRDHVFFVDASISAQEPFEVSEIKPKKDNSFSSHAMTPFALLQACSDTAMLPEANFYLLSIRGYEFGLGQKFSSKARNNLLLARQWLENKIKSI